MTEAATATKGKTVYTAVTMDDGRVVDFPGKRKLMKEVIIRADGQPQVRLDFVNGETRLFTVPEILMDQFAAHGAAQKLGDETAGLDDIDDQVLAVDNLMDRLNGGEWSQTREVSGLAGASTLVRALVEQTGKTAGEVKNFLSKKTQAEKLALRSHPAIAPIIAKIEASKKSKAKSPAIDSNALLAGLSGDVEESAAE